jgi:hypothetical protein
MFARGNEVGVTRVTALQHLRSAREVIEEVYVREKGWVESTDRQIAESDLSNPKVSWFLADLAGQPAGLLRLLYDPELRLPAAAAPSLLEGVDLEAMAKAGRFVEIGRFMVLPRFRSNMSVAMGLMRAGIREVVEGDYTHLITDVFEGEATSPYHFHTRVLGFTVIGTHLYGELHCNLRRIILTMDILETYARMKAQGNSFFRKLTEGYAHILDRKLAERRASQRLEVLT